jgi:hypothetical protein
LAGYLRWLAPRYPAVCDGLRAETAQYREGLHAEGLHARTPGILADLEAGWRWWLDFARAVGAIDDGQREAFARRVRAALLTVGAEQAAHVAAADPVEHFLRLLTSALTNGRAHLAGPEGARPKDADRPAAWGWWATEVMTREGSDLRWDAKGRRLGWIDGANIYLDPEATYAEAQELARQQGEALSVSPRTLWRRLREHGKLASWEAVRQRNTIRRTLEGGRDREVLHLHVETLSPCARPSGPSASPRDSPDSAGTRAVGVDGPADGNGGGRQECPHGPSAKPAENPGSGRSGQSDKGEESPGAQPNGPARRRGTI